MPTSQKPVRFAAVGLDHAHIFGQVNGLIAQGAELVGLSSSDPGAAVTVKARETWSEAAWHDDASELLHDPSIDLIVTAAVPDERGPIAVEAMAHGKDVVTDKPGCISFEQLDAVKEAVATSGRFWSVTFSERFEVPCVAKAGELIREGRIGKVVQTLGLGPHREGDKAHVAGGEGRPDWFYDPARYGGIITDIASHQFDQFLWFTGASTGEVVSSTVGNFGHPETPQFQDFGEVTLRTEDAQGYVRVDWFTPQGLPTWGDGRLVILGTKGYIELRKYVDIEGREGTNHLFVADDNGTEYIDCSEATGTYYPAILADVRDRTTTAAPQEHTFEVMRLALTAQAQAERRGFLPQQ
ncbi:MAG TPA: Gfo/Idh/MocA family oxidoreductase [Candidatus Avipropionibacterium avicola]|uniref:Gfo/Idh/MocA family oxidoreductase n=1 Tax=Candidatus Avipropionibacterium avicola TaxID=2840701 RepID=A0A9D1GVU6_9ACTN|nr:Gfo/Idh/MocA family oxidoreductase [Candidatus Avipropionibacterium avicola]